MLIAIKFNSFGKEYVYSTSRKDIVVGDKVIVDSPSDGYQVVDVVKINCEYSGGRELKPIVSVVDDKKYKRAVQRKNEIKDKLADVRGRIHARNREINKIVEEYKKELKEYDVELLQLNALREQYKEKLENL